MADDNNRDDLPKDEPGTDELHKDEPGTDADGLDITSVPVDEDDEIDLVDDAEISTDAIGTADALDTDQSEVAEDEVLDDEVPEELREERQDPATVPATGLVSEFHDLTSSQAAYLVAHRETTTVTRSPLFYVSALVLGLATVAALIIGFQRDGMQPGTNNVLSVVGVPEDQAEMFAQQIGIPVIVAETEEDGEAQLRSGEAGAIYVMDPTGQTQGELRTLSREPVEITERLNQPLPISYLDRPAVAPTLSDPVAWGLAGVLLLAGLTMGTALYRNVRAEKRNRLAEVIVAAIPARASAWGRVYGLTLLSLVFLLGAPAVLLVGLSVGQRTTEAVALMPGLGWFALTALATVLLMLAAHLWLSTVSSATGQRVGRIVVAVLAVAGVLLPLFFKAQATMMLVLSYVPFSSAVAMPMRYFAGQADWWEGLVAAAAALVVGLLVFAGGSAAYRRTLLAGAGRGGRVAVSRRARKAVNAGSSAKKDADSAGPAGSAKADA